MTEGRSPDCFPLRLVTPRFVLRELSLDDLDDANAVDADPEVTRYTSHEGTDLEATRKYLERSIREAKATPRRVYDFAITRPGEDRFLGRVGFNVERPAHREATLWCILARSLWNQGVGTEVVAAVLDVAFGPAGLHRVIGDCDPRNVGSARVLEKLGFMREAHLRQNWWLQGQWCDSWVYGLLEDEWRARRS